MSGREPICHFGTSFRSAGRIGAMWAKFIFSGREIMVIVLGVETIVSSIGGTRVRGGGILALIFIRSPARHRRTRTKAWEPLGRRIPAGPCLASELSSFLSTHHVAETLASRRGLKRKHLRARMNSKSPTQDRARTVHTSPRCSIVLRDGHDEGWRMLVQVLRAARLIGWDSAIAVCKSADAAMSSGHVSRGVQSLPTVFDAGAKPGRVFALVVDDPPPHKLGRDGQRWPRRQVVRREDSGLPRRARKKTRFKPPLYRGLATGEDADPPQQRLDEDRERSSSVWLDCCARPIQPRTLANVLAPRDGDRRLRVPGDVAEEHERSRGRFLQSSCSRVRRLRAMIA